MKLRYPWASRTVTPESPAAFLLRMASYEVTLLCSENVEQDATYRLMVYRAALDRAVLALPEGAQVNDADVYAICMAHWILKGKTL